jgi:hypothetical protein
LALHLVSLFALGLRWRLLALPLPGGLIATALFTLGLITLELPTVRAAILTLRVLALRAPLLLALRRLACRLVLLVPALGRPLRARLSA